MIARAALISVMLALLSGCATKSALNKRADLGDFKIGHVVVVANNVQVGPLSRTLSQKDWEASMTSAIEARFSRHTGNTPYNIGVSVVGYTLAPPGVPILFSPKSVLIISANIWDEKNPEPLNKDLKDFIVFEDLSGKTIVGSGLTRSAEEQMAVLTENAALMIEQWLAKNPKWFKNSVKTPPAPEPTTVITKVPSTVKKVAPPLQPQAPLGKIRFTGNALR